MKNNGTTDEKTHCLPIGMCLGMSVGTALGAATDNLALYMCIGLSVGMCIGALVDAKKGKENKDTPKSDEEEQ